MRTRVGKLVVCMRRIRGVICQNLKGVFIASDALTAAKHVELNYSEK